MFLLLITSINSLIPFFSFGKKPKKLKLFNGIPDNCRAGIIALGPGIEVRLILFFIQYCINLKPGSEISGDPASDIKTHFLLIKSPAILLITIFSL